MSNPHPFLKWVGGKRQILPEIAERVPATFGDYHEPFLGGGALFFELYGRGLLRGAYLSDANERLIRTWRGVRDDVGAVVTLLETYAETHARHGQILHDLTRAMSPDAGTDAEVAAWFIYLNRTSFNGLYRVNRRDGFNVPFNQVARFRVDVENLRRCSAALQDVELHVEDFAAVERAAAGDFVYLDSPYVPVSVTSSFTSYTPGGFGLEEHTRLRDVAAGLIARGVHVLASNADVPVVRELYAGFRLDEVSATRAVNSDGDKRGPVGELLIRSAEAAS